MKYRSAGADTDAPRNPISSMVDIAFLLLIFFLVATTIMPTERDLPLRLPTPGGAPSIEGEPVRVTLEGDGTVLWGEGDGEMLVAFPGEGRKLERLQEMLKLSVAAWGRNQPGVMLKVADEASHERFIEVLDAFAANGIETVGFIE